MCAGMNRHLDDVGDKALVLPFDDRSELEIVLLGREWRGFTFIHRHAEIDDTHWFPLHSCKLLFLVRVAKSTAGCSQEPDHVAYGFVCFDRPQMVKQSLDHSRA